MFPIRDTQPSYSKPVVTVFLIVINLLVFLYEFSLDGYSQNEFVATYALVPEHFQFINILTSMFLHGGWMHVLGNMWFLWIFGDNIEDILGHSKYLMFYLLCGVVASLTHILLNPGSTLPSVGASGAIAGVLGAYLLLFPRARVTTLIPIFIFFWIRDLPAIFILGLWFVLQLFSGVGSPSVAGQEQAGGVAYFAHIGGFILGMILIAVMRPRRR